MGSTRLPKGKRKTNGQKKKSDMLKMASPEAHAHEMVNIATNMILLAMLLSNRDEFGHGRARTIRGMERFKNNVMCLREGRITLEDISKTLKKELGDDILKIIGIEWGVKMLKVGDVVTIRSDLKEVLDLPEGSVVEEMLQYQGMKATIRWGEKDRLGEIYVIDIDDGKWAWDPKLFDSIEIRPKTYQENIEDMMIHCESVLSAKRTEYATEDYFHNFNVASTLQSITPHQALIGMMDKHVVSVHDLVNEHAEGREIPLDKWKEKIGDNINYLLILWAMVNA